MPVVDAFDSFVGVADRANIAGRVSTSGQVWTANQQTTSTPHPPGAIVSEWLVRSGAQAHYSSFFSSAPPTRQQCTVQFQAADTRRAFGMHGWCTLNGPTIAWHMTFQDNGWAFSTSAGAPAGLVPFTTGQTQGGYTTLATGVNKTFIMDFSGNQITVTLPAGCTVTAGPNVGSNTIVVSDPRVTGMAGDRYCVFEVTGASSTKIKEPKALGITVQDGGEPPPPESSAAGSGWGVVMTPGTAGSTPPPPPPPPPAQPPVAAFTGGQSTVNPAPYYGVFDASTSSDPDGFIETWAWTFGDGTSFTGLNATVSHVYAAAGTYTVTLTVTDNDGLTGTALQQVVMRAHPVASFTSAVTVGLEVAFDATQSSDPDGTVVAYAWAFGDGTTGTGRSPTHIYPRAGTYTVGLTVTDNDGLNASNSSTVTLLVASGAAEAIESPVRSFTEQLLVDWNGNGLFNHELSDMSPYLIEYDTERTLNTALATRLSGSVVGELQATLSSDIGERLSPWRTDQPRYRKPRTGYTVKVTTFIAGEGMRQFTGILRTLSAASGGMLTLRAWDPVDPLYRTVTVPTVIARDAPPPHVLNPGLCAYWLISDALDQVGVRMSPARLTGARMAASMHGSAAPNLGTLDRAWQHQRGKVVAEPVSFGDGQQGTPALANGPVRGANKDTVLADYVMTSPLPLTNVGDTARVVFDARWDATDTQWAVDLRSVIPGRVAPRLLVQAYWNQVLVDVYRTNGQTVTGPANFSMPNAATGVWRRVAVDVRFMTSTTVRARLQVDNGAMQQLTLTVGLASAGNTRISVDNAELRSGTYAASGPRTAQTARIQHLQVGTGEIDATVWAPWSPAADIDTDMAPLALTAGFAGSAYDLLTDLADAEQAAHGFDVTGRYFYRSRSKWRSYTPVWQVTASNALTGLSVEETQERAARTIIVPHYLPVPAVKRVYELSTALRVEARATERLTVQLSDPIIQAPAAAYGFFFDRRFEFVEYAANRLSDGTGDEANLTVTVKLRGGEADITLKNHSGFDVFLVGPSHWEDDGPPRDEFAGQPCLVIQGIAAVLGDEVSVRSEDPTSSSQATHTAPSNVWRQGHALPQALLLDLQSELHHPPPTIEDIDTKGDPRRRLMDCIQLIDPVTGVDDPAHIVSIRSRHSGGAITQTLAVQMVGPPGSWLIGMPGRSEIDLTTYA